MTDIRHKVLENKSLLKKEVVGALFLAMLFISSCSTDPQQNQKQLQKKQKKKLMFQLLIQILLITL